MALPPPLQALYDRLRGYNSGPRSELNPQGLSRGAHLVGVFDRFIQDFAEFGQAVLLELLGAAASTDADARAAAQARAGAERAAGETADALRATFVGDVQAAREARTGAEAAAGRTADELRATFTADVTASQTARKGAEDAQAATGLIRDAAAGSARDADASAKAAAASAQSVDGPAIAARIDALQASVTDAQIFAAAYAMTFGGR